MSLMSQRDFSELNEFVRVYHLDMPCNVRGYTKPFPDGFYAIILNSRLSWEQNVKTLEHELEHIKEGHLYAECDVNHIESLLHAG